MQDIINEYLSLLDQECVEQEYQLFLEKHTKFIPRNFVQNHGVHFDLVLRKLKISSDMVTDFVILSKSSISWNYILIEIEKPQSKFFKAGTFEPHADFMKGVTQIKSWKSWFNQAENKSHFEKQLEFIKKPVWAAPVSIKYVLVTGRRKEYADNKDRISTIHSYEEEDFKIMSFDSLMENVDNNIELYLGVRKPNRIELRSKKLLSLDFLGWCDDADFHLNEELKFKFLKELNESKESAKSSKLFGRLNEGKISSLVHKVESMVVHHA